MLARLAGGECSISELAEPFEMSLPAVSKHVRVLENAGLLVREKDGRVHRCNIDPAPITALPEFASAFGCKADDPMVRAADKRCEVW